MTEQADVVLDASALLSYFRDEPGAEIVRRHLASGVIISSVNWAEVLTKLSEVSGTHADAVASMLVDRGVTDQLLNIVPLTADDALMIARLRAPTRVIGLSLADRAALALALSRDIPVLTADRIWERLDIGVTVVLIR